MEYPYEENEEVYLKATLVEFTGVISEFAKVALEDGTVILVESNLLLDKGDV